MMCWKGFTVIMNYIHFSSVDSSWRVQGGVFIQWIVLSKWSHTCYIGLKSVEFRGLRNSVMPFLGYSNQSRKIAVVWDVTLSKMLSCSEKICMYACTWSSNVDPCCQPLWWIHHNETISESITLSQSLVPVHKWLKIICFILHSSPFSVCINISVYDVAKNVVYRRMWDFASQ